ncbi:helicase RepA family protein [Lichenifustis flavocetrariae]|uniref:Helicase RepA family protein n=1 Tax=Lichenifustis flavocetrariae TaxID=2949735 RepID=A0AA42CL09_9HYPH|nr:helicase RepA family protein [Lichenifustis flavocetrariae]MCW6506902.1 helicase RepA family protein [Lichenifustis flavocetrariae]
MTEGLDPAAYVTTRRYEPEDASRPAKPPRFLIEPLSAIRPVLTGSWLIKGLLPSHGLAVLYGAPGCGKSFVALDMSLHVAAGKDWAGRRVRQAGVIYVAAEGGTGFRKRVAAAREAHDIPISAPFGLITVAPNLGVEKGDAETLIREVREQCAVLKFQPGLVLLDTLARSIVGADESSSKDMGLFVSNAEAIGADLDALVVPIHHTGKSGTDRGMRGSSALHGATNAEWEILSGEGGKTIRVGKQKDGEDDVSWPFRLRTVEVGQDEDNDPVTTCVVDLLETPRHVSSAVKSKRKKLTGQASEFVKAASMAIDEAGEAVPHSQYVPFNTKGVKRQTLARYADQLGFLEGMAPKVRNSTLNRHIRTLAGDGYLGQWGNWIWLVS